MAKSLSSILSQIERLQKEAAAIQSEVITRIRKDIAKFGLTAEQLFGAASAAKPVRARSSAKPAKVTKEPKYADGSGNTWGGMGKRPEWLRQALSSGKTLDDFLINKASAPVPKKTRTAKARVKPKAAPVSKPPVKRRALAKPAARRKSGSKDAAAPAEA
jgi:DNA-binding protein H-NS